MDGVETVGGPDGGAEDVDTSGGELIIRGGTIITAEHEFVGDIVVRDGRIAAIVDSAQRMHHERADSTPDHRPRGGHGIDPHGDGERGPAGGPAGGPGGDTDGGRAGDPTGAHGCDNVPVIDAEACMYSPVSSTSTCICVSPARCKKKISARGRPRRHWAA